MLKTSIFLFALLVSSFAQAAETFALKDFAQFGIQAKAVKLVDPRLKSLSYEEDQYYLEVKLGRLTKAQFDSMMAFYGKQSKVAYDAKKEYDLVDFLHPAIQATVNQTFKDFYYDTSGLLNVPSLSDDDMGIIWPIQKSGIGSFANCWNTTTQLLRLQNASTDQKDLRYQIYWPGRWEIDEELKSEEISAEVKESKVGDALLVSDKQNMVLENESGMIQHTAYILSESLVFEKTDSSENDPYRIAFRADVVKKYKKVFPESLSISYRRYNQAGQGTFVAPTPSKLKNDVSPEGLKELQKYVPELLDLNLVAGCETAFGGGCDGVNTEFHEFKIVTNPKTGRGIFFGPRSLLDRFQALKGR